MLFQQFDWDLTHQVLFLYILPGHHMNLRDHPWKMLILWCWTNICSSQFFAKVSLMLDNPFLVPSLCKLNHISLCFIHINTKSPAICSFPSGKAIFFFWNHPWWFGPLGKFQHNGKISIKTAHVSRLSVSCDYGFCFYLESPLQWQIYRTEKLKLIFWGKLKSVVAFLKTLILANRLWLKYATSKMCIKLGINPCMYIFSQNNTFQYTRMHVVWW